MESGLSTWLLVLLVGIVVLNSGEGVKSVGRMKLRILTVNRPHATNTLTVNENGTLLSQAHANINIYSLIRQVGVGEGMARGKGKDKNKEKESPKGGSGRIFTLEAVATNRKICMNREGKLFTKPLESEREMRSEVLHLLRKRSWGGIWRAKRWWRWWGRGRRDCHWKWKRVLNFQDDRLVYSVAHSNGTVGRFLSFGKEGEGRSYRRSFDTEGVKNRGMLINFNPVSNDLLLEIIENTTFVPGKSSRVNAKVRACIKKRARKVTRVRHCNVSKVISGCKKRVARKFPHLDSDSDLDLDL